MFEDDPDGVQAVVEGGKEDVHFWWFDHAKFSQFFTINMRIKEADRHRASETQHSVSSSPEPPSVMKQPKYASLDAALSGSSSIMFTHSRRQVWKAS